MTVVLRAASDTADPTIGSARKGPGARMLHLAKFALAWAVLSS